MHKRGSTGRLSKKHTTDMHQVSPHNLRDRWNVEKILLDSRVWSVVQKWIKEKCKLILPTVKGAACTFVNRVVLSPSNQCMIFSGRGSRDENVTSYVRLCLHIMQRELRRNALWFHEERLKTLNRVENFRVGHHMISFDRFWILSRCLLDSFGTTLRCQRSRVRTFCKFSIFPSNNVSFYRSVFFLH